MTATHVEFVPGEWALWRDVAVRSAGFPAEGVLRLVSARAAGLADALLDRGQISEQDWETFRQAFAAAAADVEREVQIIAGLPAFQCAVAWQNHPVLKLAVLPLLRREPGAGHRASKYRQREDVVASYWQRYCVKNDTIGFFGPVGWTTLTADSATSFRPASQLLASREVFFEPWAIDRMALTIAGHDGMTSWLTPRRASFLHVDAGTSTVFVPGRRGIPVEPAVMECLLRCEGTRTADRIATELVKAGHASDEAEVLRILADLRKRRWISWTLSVAASPHPERELRERLTGIEPPALRAWAQGCLATLEDAAGHVDAAGDDPGKLVTALDQLDAAFLQLTGATPTRNLGKTYGGRTLVYHDARRELHLRFGGELLRALAPLDLVLTSVRWLTYQAGVRFRREIRTIYDRLAEKNTGPVTLAALWFEAMSFLHGQGRSLLESIGTEFRHHWAEILSMPDGKTRLRYDADLLRPAVRDRFDVATSGWASARYISPDLMLAAEDTDAIRRGDFEVVLGELHLAIISYGHNCFVTQHPEPGRLLAAIDADHSGPRLIPAPPKENPPRLTVRTHSALIRDADYLVELFHQTADPRRPRLLHGGDLLVECRDDILLVRVPSGDAVDVMEPFADMLTDIVIDACSMFEEGDHSPRVNFDKLVVCRETWRFSAAELSFTGEKDEARRFVAVRAWYRAQALPRRIFIKSPLEQKPFFVDFDSPAYVNLLVKAVRRLRQPDAVKPGGSDRIAITEMLPDLDQLWLTDADAHGYTTELRMTAVDLRGAIGLPAASAHQ
jgi:lantibiotic biosynthesis dehydratase-like protein